MPSKQYSPTSSEPFVISRTKIDLFLNCARCFYLDRRLAIARPKGFPFNLNSAVDHLLKKEFDTFRASGKAHPLMTLFGVDAIPFSHEKLNEWRENFKGVRYLDPINNLIVTGAVDDIWVDNKTGELIVVDYKSTAKDSEVTLDADWQIGYKRQMEVYQWLLRKSGFKVSDTGYFVYCNGRRGNDIFDAKLEFDIKLIPYKGDAGWVDGALVDIKKCLNSTTVPMAAADCDYCRYVAKAGDVA